jgi:hypothetical protein
MSLWIALIVIVAATAWLLWRIFKSTPATADPPEIVGIREPRPVRPLNRSGAVAVEEPDDN